MQAWLQGGHGTRDGVMTPTWRISNLMEHSIVIDWKLTVSDSNFLLVSEVN